MSTQNIYDLTDTWNAGGTTFTAVKMNVTDTASAAGSALIDLQIGGVSQFKVSKAGAVTAVGVAIPTISSSDTLTNKTLSSPTLSGTVTLSGSPTFSGTITAQSGAAASGTFALGTGANAVISASSGATLSINSAGYTTVNIGGTNLQFNSVAVPTISSTDTLTNKTVQTVASTTAGAGLRIPSGTAPTSPVSGDIWYDGTSLKFQDGAITRTITWT